MGTVSIKAKTLSNEEAMELRVLGMLTMALQGVLMSAQIVSSKVMISAGWPFYRILGFAHLMGMLVYALVAIAVQAKLPERRAWKWIVSRGLCSVLAFTGMSCAVQLGAPAGDVAALTSVNTVFAALMARAFLGEPLQYLHIIALLCSVCGAVLIARPSFLFGTPADGAASPSSFAYAFAVFAGFCLSCIAICARKAADTSVWLFNLSPAAWGAVYFMLLPLSPLVDDSSLQSLLDSPAEGTGWIVFHIILLILAIATNSAGSMWCPAAVSATVNSTSRILCGYVADVLLFRLAISPLSLAGAGLMLSGVIVMALVRTPTSAKSAAEAEEGMQPASEGDENESLASFVAAEFAQQEGHESTALRQRKTTATTIESPATVIGAAAL